MKVLFFAPHSAIWVHAFPEALVAEALQQAGHEVLYVTCGRSFRRFCIPMAASGLKFDAGDAEKERICKACDGRKHVIRREFGFGGFDLDSVLTAGDIEDVQRMVSSTTPDNLLQLRFEGLEVGRYALYSLLIGRKKSALTFAPDEWVEYEANLETTLRSAIACRRIIDREQPDAIVVYNALYAVNRVCVELGEARGVPGYFLHAGGNFAHRLQTLLIARGEWFGLVKHLIEHFRRNRSRPCTHEDIRWVTDHFVELFVGRSIFVYSSAVARDRLDIRRRFGIEAQRKVLLATMSSYDELFAAQLVRVMPSDSAAVFPTQVEWVRALVGFVAQRTDLHLVIRVHPREFPNRRERGKSEHAAALEVALRDLPPNVSVNWPADELSLYDLAEEADVVLNAWSSAGREMALLGLPVVVYAPELLAYPPELNYVGDTLEGYWECIETALREGWNVERLRLAYRWHAMELKTSLLDISDSFARVEDARHGSQLRRLAAAAARRVIPYFDERRDCRKRARRMHAGPAIQRVFEKREITTLSKAIGDEVRATTVEEETRALRQEVARLVQARYGTSQDVGRYGKLGRRLHQFAAAAASDSAGPIAEPGILRNGK